MITFYMNSPSNSTEIDTIMWEILRKSGKIRDRMELIIKKVPPNIYFNADKRIRQEYLIQQRLNVINQLKAGEKVIFMGMEYYSTQKEYTKRFNKVNVTPTGGLWVSTNAIRSNLNTVSTSFQIQMLFEAINNIELGRTEFLIPENPEYSIIIVDNEEKIEKFKDALYSCKTPSIDVETDVSTGKLLTIQIATDKKHAWILPTDYYIPEKIWNSVKKILKVFYEEESFTDYHIYQNGNFDIIQQLDNLNLRWYAGRVYDLMAAEFALSFGTRYSADFESPYSLGTMASYYGYEYKGVIGKEHRLRMTNFSLQDIAEYGAQDVIIPLYITELQIKKAQKYKINGFMTAVTEVMNNIIKATAFMSYNGLPLDSQYIIENLDHFESKIGKRLAEIQNWFNNNENCKKAIALSKALKGNNSGDLLGMVSGDEEASDTNFDLSSNLMLDNLFFVVMKLEGEQQEKGEGFKKDDEFKSKYKDVDEVRLYTEYKTLSQCLSTFFMNHIKFAVCKTKTALLPDSVKCQDTVTLPAEYSFTKVITGRISASKPNLQQIPSGAFISNVVRQQFKSLEKFYTQGSKKYGDEANLEKILSSA